MNTHLDIIIQLQYDYTTLLRYGSVLSGHYWSVVTMHHFIVHDLNMHYLILYYWIMQHLMSGQILMSSYIIVTMVTKQGLSK
jgi:hypothetical protein